VVVRGLGSCFYCKHGNETSGSIKYLEIISFSRRLMFRGMAAACRPMQRAVGKTELRQLSACKAVRLTSGYE
jgi:hypothetical protein